MANQETDQEGDAKDCENKVGEVNDSGANKGLTPAMQVGIIAWTIGALMLLTWNWEAAVGFALVKFGAAMLERNKPQNSDVSGASDASAPGNG